MSSVADWTRPLKRRRKGLKGQRRDTIVLVFLDNQMTENCKVRAINPFRTVPFLIRLLLNDGLQNTYTQPSKLLRVKNTGKEASV